MRIDNRRTLVRAGSILIVAAACQTQIDAPVVVLNDPIPTFHASTSSGCPAPRAGSVLVDASHDGGAWWFPQGGVTAAGFKPDSAHQGRALADYLRSRGYTV